MQVEIGRPPVIKIKLHDRTAVMLAMLVVLAVKDAPWAMTLLHTLLRGH